jgi:hypothetical protein
MSDREAFEKWWPSVGQTIGKVAAWEAWQAALQHSGEPVVDVNQQLLNDIINMMIAVKGAIRLGCYGEAYEYLNAAIAAAQESYTYSPDGKMRINKNGNFGF